MYMIFIIPYTHIQSHICRELSQSIKVANDIKRKIIALDANPFTNKHTPNTTTSTTTNSGTGTMCLYDVLVEVNTYLVAHGHMNTNNSLNGNTSNSNSTSGTPVKNNPTSIVGATSVVNNNNINSWASPPPAVVVAPPASTPSTPSTPLQSQQEIQSWHTPVTPTNNTNNTMTSDVFARTTPNHTTNASTTPNTISKEMIRIKNALMKEVSDTEGEDCVYVNVYICIWI